MVKSENKFKPGVYVCVVREGFAFFNKKVYEYGDRIVLDSQEMVDKVTGAGVRFVPEADFEKDDGGVIKKIISASRNNKTVEDVLRTAESENKKMKALYEAKIAELQEKYAELESEKMDKK